MASTHKLTPQDFFLHLGIVITLYASAISLLRLAFSIIDTVFPKVTDNYYYYQPSISWDLAMLIIVFPIFLLLSWIIAKQLKKHPEGRNLLFRRWIVYVTLFVTGAALIGTLITVLYAFLDGQDLTTGFLLKALSVLVVAGGIFKYYFFDLKGWYARSKNMLFAIGSLIIVVGMITWGFYVFGSPQTQRLTRIDQQKVSHLEQIQWQVVNYWQRKEALPNMLAELNDPISSFMAPKDPETNIDYKYQKISDLSFRLCADFNLPTPKNVQVGRDGSMTMPSMPYPYVKGSWEHGPGEACFTRDIDPELYPPTKIMR
ncbi:hypothetical protein KW782_02765 [Candidatus Parcubacteria bacterium]|nr:hypothetical protein [Candidatus Parcubacteria bacterium]